jgi:hypothetical protein
MKKVIAICTLIVLALSFQDLSARTKYPGKRHTTTLVTHLRENFTSSTTKAPPYYGTHIKE